MIAYLRTDIEEIVFLSEEGEWSMEMIIAGNTDAKVAYSILVRTADRWHLGFQLQ